MTTSLLLIVQIVLVIAIVIVVLLQKSSSIGLGAYSGSNESVFGAKGPGSFLAKATFTIGALFLINTIALGYLYSKQKNESVVDSLTPSNVVHAPKIPVQQQTAKTTQTASAVETNTTK